MVMLKFELHSGYVAWAGLFTEVKNGKALQDNRRMFNCAFINCALITSIQHVSCGVNKALQNYASNKMKTDDLFTEIVYCLSPSTRVSESLSQFGVTSETRTLLGVCFDLPNLDIARAAVDGNVTGMERLSRHTNFQGILKAFDISTDELISDRSIISAVYSRIAVKDL